MENGLKFKITRMHKIEGESSLKAYADLAINETLLFKGLRVVEGKNGLFVSMPREKGKDGKWYETIRPMNKEVKDQISLEVLSAYNERN